MTYEALTPKDFSPFGRSRASRRLVLQTAPGAIAIALSAIVGTWMLCGHTADTLRLGYAPSAPALSPPSAAEHGGAFVSKAPRGSTPTGVRANVVAKTAAPMSPAVFGALIVPNFTPGHAPLRLTQSFPMSAGSEAAAKPPAAPMVVAAVEPSHAVSTPPAVADLAPAAAPEASTPDVPMPMPRPRFLSDRATAPAQARRPMAQQAPQPSAQPVAPGTPAVAPSFFDRLFGGASETKPRGTALAYATPLDGTLGSGLLRPNPTGRVPTHDPHTAIYDISAHTVYLPDGTQLEAHSGLGDQFDDPRAVAVKMSGPTPPAVYELTLRESLFHGVQALRLTPVRGDTFGRTGLLAHRFMMGPRGDSNGCVSVRDYDAFLQAYTRGQIRHLVVVASLR